MISEPTSTITTSTARKINDLVRQLEALGHTVTPATSGLTAPQHANADADQST
jgi:hypothetical protein